MNDLEEQAMTMLLEHHNELLLYYISMWVIFIYIVLGSDLKLGGRLCRAHVFRPLVRLIME